MDPSKDPGESAAGSGVSVVVPVYNEAANIETLFNEIRSALEPCCGFELVFVDDGSDDGTGALLGRLAETDPRLRCLSHPVRRGQSAALRTGIAAARGSGAAATADRVLTGVTAAELQAETVFITIGSGDFTGVYFPTGLTIAKMINDKRNLYGIRAAVESTRGSVFNLNAIMAGYLEFGLAQSDIQYEAVKGLTAWAKKAATSFPGLE